MLCIITSHVQNVFKDRDRLFQGHGVCADDDDDDDDGCRNGLNP
jgi:hypothetical protein